MRRRRRRRTKKRSESVEDAEGRMTFGSIGLQGERRCLYGRDRVAVTVDEGEQAAIECLRCIIEESCHFPRVERSAFRERAELTQERSTRGDEQRDGLGQAR